MRQKRDEEKDQNENKKALRGDTLQAFGVHAQRLCLNRCIVCVSCGREA